MRGVKLSPDDIGQIQEMRADGHTIMHVAATLGFCRWTVWKYASGRIGKVPVAPLREAFLVSPVCAADVARELGWWSKPGSPDTSRVERTLGIQPDRKRYNGHCHVSYRTFTDAETVALIAEAINVSPWAVLPDEDVA